jgi:hypothetical protein
MADGGLMLRLAAHSLPWLRHPSVPPQVSVSIAWMHPPLQALRGGIHLAELALRRGASAVRLPVDTMSSASLALIKNPR